MAHQYSSLEGVLGVAMDSYPKSNLTHLLNGHFLNQHSSITKPTKLCFMFDWGEWIEIFNLS